MVSIIVYIAYGVSAMTKFVTFCTFDHTVEGNPAWHGAFFLSQTNLETKQVDVVETWGFYGVPSTGDPQHWATRFKKSLGLDVDFFGNHGVLEHEEVRYMDLGHGLHGYSYELTDEQFSQLQVECQKRITEQEAAISEALRKINLDTLPTKVRRYRGEQFSKEIYQIELNQAKIEGRKPRLLPFDFKLSWKNLVPSLQESHTCKTEALCILSTVLTPEQLAPYHKSTFPRFVSGGMEELALFSVGKLSEHTKASGEKVFFRNGKDPGVKLIWALTPQNFDELPGSGAKAYFAVDKEYCGEARKVIRKLQRLDWLLRNAEVPNQYKEYQTRLVERVVDCYMAFSIIESETKTAKIEGWRGSVYSFFEWPKNQEQKNLMSKIKAAKDLFNALYMAIVDDWEIFDELPPEPAILSQQPVTMIGENALEALAAYLKPDVQKKLCAIIGRTYCEPQSIDEYDAVSGADQVASI